MTEYKVQFEQKEVDAIQTLAEVLRLAREEKELYLEDLASEMQISPFYLEALESGNYHQLPCLVYTRNFVKSYSLKLGLPIDLTINLLENEWELFSKHQQRLFENKKQTGVSRRDLWRMPKWIRWGISTIVISAVFVYFGAEIYALRQPPKLIVHSPQEEIIIDKQVINISGETEPETTLKINNQEILSDINGNFEEIVALQPGLNVVEITAERKHSQQSKVYRKIIVDDNSAITELFEETSEDYRS